MTDPFLSKLIHHRLINVKDYIINHYVPLGLNEQEAMMLIHIYNLSEEGEQFLAINTLTKRMTLDFVACSDLVYKLVKSNFIAFQLNIDEKGKTKEKFTLEPFYTRIMNELMNDQDKDARLADENKITQLISLIEIEFGRTLSAYEIQMISSWLHDFHYDVEIIKLALREALTAKATNLKYIDRILLTWQQNQVDTVEKAREYSKTFKRYEVKKESSDPEEKYVSWMK